MVLTKQQAQAAYASGSVAVTAGAGTGKTHMLSERYLYFLKSEYEGQPKPGFSPLQIVAVTFTEKAATELRSRIRQTVAASQLPNQADLLADLEAAQISTFHALAARICREHPDKAEVPPNFAVQDQLDSPLWLAETFGDALVNLPEYLYETIPYSRMREILSALLADPLTAEQALQRGRADWEPLVEQTQQKALNELLHNAQWLWGKNILESYAAPGDRLDAYRLEGLEAISSIEQGDEIAPALANLTGLKVNRLYRK